MNPHAPDTATAQDTTRCEHAAASPTDTRTRRATELIPTAPTPAYPDAAPPATNTATSPSTDTDDTMTAATSRTGRRRGAAVLAALLPALALPVSLAVLVSLVALVLLPGVASAAVDMVPMQGQEPAPAASVDQVLTNVRNWIMGIAGALATVFLTVGAVRYMAAGGDLGEVEKAKTAFRSAAFGYAIAVLAPLVVTVLRGIVGA